MIKRIFIPFLMFYLLACHSNGQTATKGIVILQHQFLDKKGTPVFSSNTKIWYKDSVAIEEIEQIKINTDTQNVTTINKEVAHYLYIDHGTNSFYEYKFFSDTATIIKKYTQADSATLSSGGWNFFYDRKIDIIGEPETLEDTIIANIRYKRVKLIRDIGKGSFINICWHRCDIKGSLFSLYRYRNEKNSCPVVKNFNFEIGQIIPSTAMTIEHISATLTEQELRVLEAWKRNAKFNPVK